MRKQIGKCFVDSGLIWVGDPCYTVAKDNSHVWETWSDFCNQIGDSDIMDCDGIGIAIGGFGGDGVYPVYADMDSHGGVRSVTIDFRAYDEEDYEEEGEY